MKSLKIIIICLVVLATQTFGKIGIIVNKDLYPLVSSSIQTFKYELEVRGYEVILQSTYYDATKTVASLRNYLRVHHIYNNLEGAILIGDLPIAEYEIEDDFNIYGYKHFPIDLYFMDLDGTWSDSALDGDWGGNAQTGVFDGHSDGTGDRQVEIWVSRLIGSSVPGIGTEADVVNNYFNRLKIWMDGDDPIDNNLLILGNDEEWGSTVAWGGAGLLGFAPAEVTTYLRSVDEDTDDNWMLGLRDGQKYALITEHSSPTNHWMIDQFNTGEYLNMPVAGDPSNTRFYNLFACSNSRYTVSDFFGGLYAWGHNGLISMGSTKTGAMLDFNTYNTQLGMDATFGEAFKHWLNNFVLVSPISEYRVSWHYGMTLCGVGTLTLNYQSDICFEDVPDPIVTLEGTETYTVRGNTFTRFELDVSNTDLFPDALFASAPHLPPCGLNTNSSRTWVRIYDNNDHYIYGFCGLGSSASLNNIWFAIEIGGSIPDSIYIVLCDRECDVEYVSDLIPIQNSIPMPSYTYTYSSSSRTRGYYFTAPVDFIITELKVPDEQAQGTQNVDVIKFTSGIPPTYPSTTNSITSLYRGNGYSSSSYIKVHIPVSAGDVIGILGTAGSAASLKNSYGNGDFSSNILGNSVTLRRLGMQYNQITYTPRYLWTQSGNIARVDFKYIVGN